MLKSVIRSVNIRYNGPINFHPNESAQNQRRAWCLNGSKFFTKDLFPKFLGDEPFVFEIHSPGSKFEPQTVQGNLVLSKEVSHANFWVCCFGFEIF